ncbi:MAG: methyltransferase domain-containing protein [Alphaproteobacteria bacterium]|jgi:SAM-dependent methyltransferase|nr:methyltransferase domain-containing protein [Alphaproteobacteria bacterium]MBT4711220.1 methyltransferase domain-containing protein [Alphaproteobacteria bacterium]
MADSHAQFSGNIPEIYDQHLGPAFFAAPAAHMAKQIADAVSGVSNPRVLEVACGTGIVTEALRGALADDIEIIATDLNPAMLEYAQSVRGDLANVNWQQADGQDLSTLDGAFDAVVCQFGLMFFPEKEKGLAAMAGVLNPGGTLAVSTWNSLEKNTLPGLGQEVLATFFDENPPMFLSVPFGMHDPGVVTALMMQAGIDEVQIETRGFEYERPKARHLAVGMVQGNPGIHEINERANAPAEEIIDAMEAAMARDFGDNPLRAHSHAIFASGVKG